MIKSPVSWEEKSGGKVGLEFRAMKVQEAEGQLLPRFADLMASVGDLQNQSRWNLNRLPPAPWLSLRMHELDASPPGGGGGRGGLPHPHVPA